MAPPGPRPKPTVLRLLDGGHRERVNPAEPVPRSALPMPPAYMTEPALTVWHRVVAELDVMGIATAADADALACLVEAVVTHERASALVAEEGMLVVGTQGTRIRHPALSVQRDAAKTVRAFCAEFGLTPSARSRVVVRLTPAEPNPFAGPVEQRT